MNDYWHIPRASLTPSSTSGASSAASSASSSTKSHRSHKSIKGNNSTNAATTAAAAAAVLAAATHNANSIQNTNSNKKRGSRSSQGSNDSNNSTKSAASGSLLLTTANLERFAEIHKKQERQQKRFLQELPNIHATNTTQTLALPHTHTIYSTNLSLMNAGKDTVIPIDPNLEFIKTKDLDTVSIASSMHFTMVNGDSGAAKKQKRGLCDRGRQVTVLIVSMSTIFMLLIMGMVYALEMRARDMPKS